MTVIFTTGKNPKKQQMIAGHQFKYGTCAVTGDPVKCGNAEISFFHRRMIPDEHIFDSDEERKSYWNHMSRFYLANYEKGAPKW